MANPFKRFNTWRKSTYLSAVPIFGAGSGGDIMQVGPLAILSSLLDKSPEEKPNNEQKPFKRNVNRPPDAQQEVYVYQDERFDFVIYDWNPGKEEFFDENFVSGLAQVVSGYVADPINEKDHAWAFM